MHRSISIRTVIALLILLVVATGFAAACRKEPPPAPQTVAPQSPVEIPMPVAPMVTPAPAAAPPAPVLPPPGAQPVAPLPEPAAQPIPAPQPEAKPEFKPESVVVLRDFYLDIAVPDETVMKAASMKMEGSTLPASMVTVNGNTVEVDEMGKFSTPVALEEGPNVFEIVASDFQGNQRSAIITVIRLP